MISQELLDDNLKPVLEQKLESESNPLNVVNLHFQNFNMNTHTKSESETILNIQDIVEKNYNNPQIAKRSSRQSSCQSLKSKPIIKSSNALMMIKAHWKNLPCDPNAQSLSIYENKQQKESIYKKSQIGKLASQIIMPENITN